MRWRHRETNAGRDAAHPASRPRTPRRALLLVGLLTLALVGSHALSAWQQGDRAGVLGSLGGLVALGGVSLAGAYRPFALAAGNELVASHSAAAGAGPGPAGAGRPAQRGAAQCTELAGLCHLPQAADEAAALERTTVRRRLLNAGSLARTPLGFERPPTGRIGCSLLMQIEAVFVAVYIR
jgi:hypothetical protein